MWDGGEEGVEGGVLPPISLEMSKLELRNFLKKFLESFEFGFKYFWYFLPDLLKNRTLKKVKLFCIA